MLGTASTQPPGDDVEEQSGSSGGMGTQTEKDEFEGKRCEHEEIVDITSISTTNYMPGGKET